MKARHRKPPEPIDPIERFAAHPLNRPADPFMIVVTCAAIGLAAAPLPAWIAIPVMAVVVIAGLEIRSRIMRRVEARRHG